MARRGSYAMATEDAMLVDEFNVAAYALGPRVGGPSRLMRQQLGLSLGGRGGGGGEARVQGLKLREPTMSKTDQQTMEVHL